MNKKWITITASKESKTTTIDIEGTIGGEGFWSDVPAEQEATKENVKAALKEIGAVKGDKIIVNINSYGGDVNHGISIHDLLAQNPAKKVVYINGMTASAATVIAMAGDEINMSDNALFLVHRASTIGWGNATEMKTVLKDLESIDSLMANIYAKRTGKPVAEIFAQMDKSITGEWMSADEAKEFGFIDNVYEPTKMAASFDKKFFAKAGLPEIPENKLKQNLMDEKTLTQKIAQGIKDFFANNKETVISAEIIEAKSKEIAQIEVEKYNAEIENIKAENNEAIEKLTADNKAIVDAKDKEIESLKATIEENKTALEAKQSELDSALGKETKAKGDKKDPDITGSKRKLTANEASAEASAKQLKQMMEDRANGLEEEETEEEA